MEFTHVITEAGRGRRDMPVGTKVYILNARPKTIFGEPYVLVEAPGFAQSYVPVARLGDADAEYIRVNRKPVANDVRLVRVERQGATQCSPKV